MMVLALLAMLLVSGCGSGFLTGIHEFDYAVPANRDIALDRTKNAHADLARMLIYWSVVAANQPPSSAAARDPNWSGYNWSSFDAQVEAIKAKGLEPLVVVLRAPPWAEGPGRPSNAVAGSWKPSESAYRDFAEAAARRYSGSIEPRVRYWQAWNEPNVNAQLAPLWTTINGNPFPSGPYIYKGLLNAFYDGIKAVDETNLVVTAGATTYGYPPGLPVMHPAYFWRRVLCLNDGQPPSPLASCAGGPARFDVLAHQLYTYRPPSEHAANADDVLTAEMSKLTGPLNTAVDAGYVYPQVAKPVWVTELAYDSNPPDPTAPSIADQATWLEASMYKLWKQGVSAFVWFGLRDREEGAGWASTIQTGLYFRGATIADDFPKPSLVAFRFPFTAYRTTSTTVDLWGIAPEASKPVVIQRQVGGNWSTVATVDANDARMFEAPLNIANGAVLRAVQNGENSLSWTTAASGP